MGRTFVGAVALVLLFFSSAQTEARGLRDHCLAAIARLPDATVTIAPTSYNEVAQFVGTHRGIQEFIPYLNVNASVPAHLYRMDASRNLSKIDAEFGPSLPDFRKTLKPGQVIVDVGGAWSVYGLELARAGYRVKVINTQNFYRALEGIALSHKIELRETLPGQIHTIGGIPVESLNNVGQELGVSWPAGTSYNGFLKYSRTAESSVLAKELREFAQSLYLAYLHRVETTPFEYQIGYAENLLANITDAGLLIDSYGPFTYSAHRPLLLARYLNSLHEGGKAFIKTNHVADRVNVGSTSRFLLAALTEKFPDVFSNDGALHSTLIIVRPDEARLAEVLDYLARIKFVSFRNNVDDPTGYISPASVYQLQTSPLPVSPK